MAASGRLDRKQVARLAKGRLDQVPFALLLHAVAAEERTGTLEVERRQLRKRIALEEGVPVDCWSNLAHETLGRFMVRLGRLDQPTADACLAEAFASGQTLGQVLLDRSLLDAEELIKLRRQNLASKLLDVFSWREGVFRMLPGAPEVKAPLSVNPAQLVLMGIARFATEREVNAGIGPLVGRPLVLNPDPPYAEEEVRPPAVHRSLLETLGRSVLRLDELADASELPFDELSRALYALSLLEIIVPADSLAPGRRRIVPQAAQETASGSRAADQDLRAELLELVLSHREKDAFELLGVSEDDSAREVRRRYLEFAERYAPWRFDTSLVDSARDVFVAAAHAYAILSDPEKRDELITSRLTREEGPVPQPEPRRPRVRTLLLDPDVQFRRGKTLMNSGHYEEAIRQLEYALDLDSQNAVYCAELAYCRFLQEPSRMGEEALAELSRALRIDEGCGLALFYKGEILRRMGRFDQAEECFRSASRAMAPDRRPVDALYALNQERDREG